MSSSQRLFQDGDRLRAGADFPEDNTRRRGACPPFETASQSSAFTRVCRIAEVPEGQRKLLEIDDQFLLLFHVEGQFFAIDDCCTHDGGPLCDGLLQGFSIVCPRHGAKFDIRTGRVLSMPATRDVRSYEVKVEGDELLVKL